MSDFLNQLKDRVLLCDGAMGVLIQGMNLSVDKDFMGKENCSEILNITRPELIRDVHRQYFAAGADMVETNSFGASPITLGEFDISDKAYDLSKISAEIAREAAEEFKDGRSRFVIGSVGPGTKLPSLGHIDYDSLEASYVVQCKGLIDGGADAILVETCQDPLQFKAAINGAKLANKVLDKNIPIMLQVTIETTGTMLVGTEIGAAANIAESLGVVSMGLNCATGPQEMAEHIKWLGENWTGYISAQPNAGLPELVDGKTHYPLCPDDLAMWHERYINEYGVNIVGGCCGNTPLSIKAVDGMLKRISKDNYRPTPVQRKIYPTACVSSLYSRTPLRQENSFFSIGERCNANGSKIFKDIVNSENWDKAVSIAKEQIRSGSNSLDVCTAYVGRDEVKDMSALVGKLRTASNVPLVFDSTETPVLETCLKLYGGKAIINSINLEDGGVEAEKRLELAKKFGAAVIALTIDENGMAKDAKAKVEIAKRLYDLACNKHGLAPSDLIFDPLTFTICTGNEDDKKLGLETLDAIETISKELPECQIALGLSNISFGLKPAARTVLNSVFLHHALKKGMTGAIVHVSKMLPLHQIDEKELQVAEDLIFDKSTSTYNPLMSFIKLFEGKEDSEVKASSKPTTIEEKLEARIVDGDKEGLEADLHEAMKKYPPIEIINKILLGGMKIVGEYFGSGKMQLPFVLQSAETMKAAVAVLEPFMEKVEGQTKGSMVLATVKGDVHDIGKNLVDIILSNNGFTIFNLGIKQPIHNIIEAVEKYKPSAIGMSGLLVKSTVIMKDNLIELSERGIDIPVILGGAALTRDYVEGECVKAYKSGRVAYAGSAFEGLELMNKIAEGSFDDYLKEIQEKRNAAIARRAEAKAKAKKIVERPVEETDAVDDRLEEIRQEQPIPEAPFYSETRLVDGVSLKALAPFVNKTMLYKFHWGYKDDLAKDEWKEKAKKEYNPIFNRILEQAEDNKQIVPRAIYGYWKCASDGDDVIIFDKDGVTEIERITYPRQKKGRGLCIADYIRNVKSSERDVIAFQVATVGEIASETELSLFNEGKFQDYLYFHGMSVELVESMAEYVHRKIRSELGILGSDSDDFDKLVKLGYQGCRYSFGYPACPNLEEQEKLLRLLGAERIGVTLGEEKQLSPEFTTSAFVLHHKMAGYFAV